MNLGKLLSEDAYGLNGLANFIKSGADIARNKKTNRKKKEGSNSPTIRERGVGNHYVHGSKGAFDYQKHFMEFAFITSTLEFVFAASDLLDQGWDLKSWMDEGTWMTHPISAYIVNYAENMHRLKALVLK